MRLLPKNLLALPGTPSRYSLLTGEYAWRRKDTGVATGDAIALIQPEEKRDQ